MIPAIEIEVGANEVTLSGTIVVAGGFAVSSAAALHTTGSAISFYGQFGTFNLAPGAFNYNDVTLNGALEVFDLGGAILSVGGHLNLAETDYRSSSHINNGTILAGGDVNVSGLDGWRGSVLLKLIGNASGQTLTGVSSALIPNFENAAGANAVTFSGAEHFYGNYTLTSVGTFNAAGSTTIFDSDLGASNVVKPGSVTYGNVQFISQLSTVDLNAGTLKVGGNLSFGCADGRAMGRLNNGTLLVSGNISTAGGPGCTGSALARLIGNASGQTIAGTAGSNYPNLEIATGLSSITFKGTVELGGSYNVTSFGSLTATGSTLNFNAGGTNNISPGAGANYSTINFTANSTYLLLSDLTTGSLSLGANATLTKNAHMLTVGGSTAGSGSLYGGQVSP